jgi:hypothetical protein
MMVENEMPSFMDNIPSMNGFRSSNEQSQAKIPINIPDGVSVLDVARQVPLAAPVAQALTKNYSAMLKLIDKKRSKI